MCLCAGKQCAQPLARFANGITCEHVVSRFQYKSKHVVWRLAAAQELHHMCLLADNQDWGARLGLLPFCWWHHMCSFPLAMMPVYQPMKRQDALDYYDQLVRHWHAWAEDQVLQLIWVLLAAMQGMWQQVSQPAEALLLLWCYHQMSVCTAVASQAYHVWLVKLWGLPTQEGECPQCMLVSGPLLPWNPGAAGRTSAAAALALSGSAQPSPIPVCHGTVRLALASFVMA